MSRPYNPALRRFGLFRFRSPLLTESILFLFLRVAGDEAGRVSPLGDRRIEAHIQLRAAYRR